MSTAIKLSDDLVAKARREARVMRRSIAKQVEYWAELGRCIEKSGQFDSSRIEQFLTGGVSYDELQPTEQALARRRLDDHLDHLPDVSEVFRASRVADGLAMSGYDPDRPEKLVTVHPDGEVEDLE